MEGQGRTLEEIDTMYRLKVKPWKSSKFVFPASHGEVNQTCGKEKTSSEDIAEAEVNGTGNKWSEEGLEVRVPC
jgi:SP family sugar:H+ symporter-like MFS transporter